MKKSIVVDALEQVRKKNRKGKLLPREVVESAANPESPLHSYFDWNDSSAAAKYRDWQARQLIASVEIVADNRFESSPVYVSLASDRLTSGYRAVKDVLQDDALRQEMLETALGELKAIQWRYERLKELAGVFREVAKVEQSGRRKHKNVA